MGLLHAAYRNKWTFMVGSQAIRYRYAISPMRMYEIHTNTAAIDDVWIYMNQSFATPAGQPSKRPRVFAQATVRAIVMSFKGERISPMRALDEMGISKDVQEKLYRKDAQDFDGSEVAGFLEWDRHIAEEMKSKFE